MESRRFVWRTSRNQCPLERCRVDGKGVIPPRVPRVASEDASHDRENRQSSRTRNHKKNHQNIAFVRDNNISTSLDLELSHGAAKREILVALLEVLSTIGRFDCSPQPQKTSKGMLTFPWSAMAARQSHWALTWANMIRYKVLLGDTPRDALGGRHARNTFRSAQWLSRASKHRGEHHEITEIHNAHEAELLLLGLVPGDRTAILFAMLLEVLVVIG